MKINFCLNNFNSVAKMINKQNTCFILPDYYTSRIRYIKDRMIESAMSLGGEEDISYVGTLGYYVLLEEKHEDEITVTFTVDPSLNPGVYKYLSVTYDSNINRTIINED